MRWSSRTWGSDWVPLREAVSAGTLRPADRTIADVTARFDALLRYTALHLGRRLGTDVTVQLSRKERAEPAVRAQMLAASLVESGTLTGSIRIPDTVGDIKINVDLRAGKISCELEVDAPKTGRPATRVNWLVRQLREAPESLRVEAQVSNQRGPGATELLRLVREDPAVLVADQSKEIKAFTSRRPRPSEPSAAEDAVHSSTPSSPPSTPSTRRWSST